VIIGSLAVFGGARSPPRTPPGIVEHVALELVDGIAVGGDGRNKVAAHPRGGAWCGTPRIADVAR
jgi:hypothetical protein